MGDGSIVIVGAGHAGFQLAASLRQAGSDAPILLLGDEPHLPYQRPPLSKAYLDPAKTPDSLHFRPEAFLTQNRIDFRPDTRVAAIDRRDGLVETAGGATFRFDRLVLATGTRNRDLPVPGADLDGVVGLRTIADAHRLRAVLAGASDVVVIGAGFVGLEVAATAAKRGLRVTVVETVSRVMQRVVSPATSAFFRAAHERAGIGFLFDAKVVALQGEGGRVRAVELADGRRIPADLVLVGIGVVPNAEIAAAAGLATGNGILVDGRLGTEDPRILAIGDGAAHPSRYAPGPVRIESVQNATDQAKAAAVRLTGGAGDLYEAVPWFWSDQGALKLQIAGLSQGVDHWVTRGEPESGAFSVFGYRNGRLATVESVMKPADHMIARRLIAAGLDVPGPLAADPSVDLKGLLGG